MGRRKGHKKCDRAVQEYESSNPSDTTEPDCLINIPQLRAISIRFTFLYRYDCSCGTQSLPCGYITSKQSTDIPL